MDGCDGLVSPSPRSYGRGKELPMRIGIDHAAPAAAVEGPPAAFLLRKAISHREDSSRMMAHAAMAALDLDALGLRARLLHAALPGADAVGAAEDRRGRHRRRDGEIAAELRIDLVGFPPARPFIDAPGIGRMRIAGKGAAERDHLAHAVGHHFGELARIETAEAPADQADLAAMPVAELLNQIHHRVLHALAGPLTPTPPPRPPPPRAGRNSAPAPSRSPHSPCPTKMCATRAWTRR